MDGPGRAPDPRPGPWPGGLEALRGLAGGGPGADRGPANEEARLAGGKKGYRRNRAGQARLIKHASQSARVIRPRTTKRARGERERRRREGAGQSSLLPSQPVVLYRKEFWNGQ